MRKLRNLIRCAAFALPIIATTGCSDDVENTYANLAAYFYYTPVTGAPTLYRALNNGGLYAIATYTSAQITFTGNDGTSNTTNRSALSTTYSTIRCLNGFIIGTPAVPDYSGNFYQICYELACPNCYRDDWIQRSLTFTGSNGTAAYCSRCGRTYDLENYGIITDGDDGISLYRYRMSYSSASDILIVSN